MMKLPRYSPWGEIQHLDYIQDGIYDVSTASHGGIMVDVSLADKIFSKAAQKCGFVEGRYLCFEEDCDAAVAIRELLDKGIKQTPINKEYREGSYSEAINRNIQRWNPEYWKYYEAAHNKVQVVPKAKIRRDWEER